MGEAGTTGRGPGPAQPALPQAGPPSRRGRAALSSPALPATDAAGQDQHQQVAADAVDQWRVVGGELDRGLPRDRPLAPPHADAAAQPAPAATGAAAAAPGRVPVGGPGDRGSGTARVRRPCARRGVSTADAQRCSGGDRIGDGVVGAGPGGVLVVAAPAGQTAVQDPEPTGSRVVAARLDARRRGRGAGRRRPGAPGLAEIAAWAWRDSASTSRSLCTSRADTVRLRPDCRVIGLVPA